MLAEADNTGKFHVISFNALQPGVWSQLCLIWHPGLKAQVYVVCDKSKLVGILFTTRA